jgi:hypothetical protein
MLVEQDVATNKAKTGMYLITFIGIFLISSPIVMCDSSAEITDRDLFVTKY